MLAKTQAVAYLRAVLRGGEPLDPARVLALFRAYEPTGNPAKLAAIHDPRAVVSIVLSDYGSKCFAINGHTVSSKLRKPTSHALLNEACRTAIEADMPAALKRARRPGIELDHQNRGGFAAIVRDMKSRHDVGTLLEHIHKPAGSSRHTLSEPMRSEFIQLHRVCTDNWGSVVALSQQQHRDLTQKRKRDESDAD
jgi:hypothetical protein